QSRPWPETGRPRRAAVSAFGMSGTNAHLILEEAPAQPVSAEGTPSLEPVMLPATPWLLSARSQAALQARARQLLDHLDTTEDRAVDVAYSLAVHSSQHPHRAAIVAADRDALTHALTALAGDGHAPGLVRAATTPIAEVVFVFPGQGSQWAGMAVELLDSAP